MTERVRLLSDRIETPVGRLTLIADEAGQLHALGFTDGQAPVQRLRSSRTGEELGAVTPSLNPGGLSDALRAYFAGELRAIADLGVVLHGTEFQERVWRALREVPCGETRSYGEIARRIGNPAAVRAVGRANHDNPVAIVVPCHRVVGTNGALTGYAGGIERKRWLLTHEQALLVVPKG